MNEAKIRLFRRDCNTEAEFAELQRYRGVMSGEARRRRNRDRDRLIVRYRCALGMKMYAVALHCRVSISTVHRVVQEALGRLPARVRPTVPAVLARLRHTLFTNRLIGQEGKEDRRSCAGCYGVPALIGWVEERGPHGLYAFPVYAPDNFGHRTETT